MTTITASTTMGIDLSPASYTSPVVVGAGVAVSNPGYPYAVYRHVGATTFFIIQNDGSIVGNKFGVYLAPGGSVTNAATASITADKYAVKISGGAGTVVNDGNIAGTGTRGSGVGVQISGGPGTVVNYGSIAGTSVGVTLGNGGSVTNAAPAYIRSVYIASAAGTVVNHGRIVRATLFGGSVTNTASASINGGVEIGFGAAAGTVVNDGRIAGVTLVTGGSVTNAAPGYIRGIDISSDTGTVVNDGRIVGLALLGAGGSVTNAALASIMGYNGVVVYGGGTLTNAGSIVGGSGTAVAFGGTGSHLLVLDAGFGFSGIVAGGTSSSNTLELASTASAGTVTGLGSEFTNFGSIVFDAGAQWLASGVQSGLAGPITGFATGDTIELTGDTAVGSSFVTGILTLDLAGGGSDTLDLPGTFTSASDFEVTNVAAGADVTVACFAAGTRILTAAGEVPVEELCFGDRVPTLGSRLARIAWLGHHRIDCRRYTCPTGAWPIRVRAGALGERLPARDLLLSPDHAVFVGGVLIPIRHLFNGCTVVQEPVEDVTYYHVELATHDVILAEGLPCESYLDTGNRAAFANGGAETLAQRG